MAKLAAMLAMDIGDQNLKVKEAEDKDVFKPLSLDLEGLFLSNKP